MQGYPITFNIYADNEGEVAVLHDAVVSFISSHARQGRAVTAKKLADALSRWESNPFVRNRIIDYFR